MDSAATLTHYQDAVETLLAEMVVYYKLARAGAGLQVSTGELARWIAILKAARGENP